MSLLSKTVLLGLAGTALAQEAAVRDENEQPMKRTYVTSFGNTDSQPDAPVWEMEFLAGDDDEAQHIAEEDSIETFFISYPPTHRPTVPPHRTAPQYGPPYVPPYGPTVLCHGF